MACEDYPTAATAKTFKLDAGTTNEVVTLERDRTSEASDGKTKKTFWGIESDATLQRDNIELLAESQRDQFNSTFQAQFAYKRIGNISDYAGGSLPEADKLNSYQFPDSSGEWYGPIQSQTFPITIPADPSGDAGWTLTTAATQGWVSDTVRNPNLLSNHNFLTPSPDSITQPSSTPTDYVAGTQIFSGVFVESDAVGLTYINGRVKWTNASGVIYLSVPNSSGIEHVTEFTASVADFDGKPRTRGVSFALVGGEYRVSVGIDALSDGVNETLLGSVKLEQGSVATGHGVSHSDKFAATGRRALRTREDRARDVRDIRDFGGVSGGDSARNSDAMEAAIAESVIDGDLQVRANVPFTYSRKILMANQGLTIDFGSRWGGHQVLDSDSTDNALIDVTARLCKVIGGRIQTDIDKSGIILSSAQGFDIDSTVFRGSLVGIFHKEGNSVTARALFMESCVNGYIMQGFGDGNTNGCVLQGRSFNCEVGFDIRENSAPSGAANPTMHNVITWSAEGNTVGFKQRGGRYNYLNVYSESNNRASTLPIPTPNANWDTDNSANIWNTRNPDNQPDIIKNPSAQGIQTSGGSVYTVNGKVQNAVVSRAITSNTTINYDAQIFNLTNPSGATRTVTLGFAGYMGVGETIVLYKLDNTPGFNLGTAPGFAHVGDTGQWGALVSSGVAELRVTRLDNNTALLQSIAP